MGTKKVTDETFEADVLKNDKPVLVDYWAEWCGSASSPTTCNPLAAAGAGLAPGRPGRRYACHASRRARSGVIEPSRRSSATSTSSRHDTVVFSSSRSRGKWWCGRTVLNPTASR